MNSRNFNRLVLHWTIAWAFLFYGWHQYSKPIPTVTVPVALPNSFPVSKSIALNDEEMLCLQQNIYFEARNESEEGLYAVAFVTLNRTANPKFPDSVCGVVWQRKQFSWTHDGKRDRPNLANVLERRAWEKAGRVAREVVSGEIPSVIGDAVYYHADYVAPRWAKKMVEVAEVGSHIFYVDGNNKKA